MLRISEGDRDGQSERRVAHQFSLYVSTICRLVERLGTTERLADRISFQTKPSVYNLVGRVDIEEKQILQLYYGSLYRFWPSCFIWLPCSQRHLSYLVFYSFDYRRIISRSFKESRSQ